MKYLIVSDIHGSLPALEQVLRVYEEEHCEMMLILGDILNYGPRNRIPEGIDPKGIADRLNAMKENIVAVRGNCDSEVDQMLLQFPDSPSLPREAADAVAFEACHFLPESHSGIRYFSHASSQAGCETLSIPLYVNKSFDEDVAL